LQNVHHYHLLMFYWKYVDILFQKDIKEVPNLWNFTYLECIYNFYCLSNFDMVIVWSGYMCQGVNRSFILRSKIRINNNNSMYFFLHNYLPVQKFILPRFHFNYLLDIITKIFFLYIQKITMKSLVKEFFLKGGNYKKKIIQGIIIMFTSTIKKKMPSIFAYYFNVI
jgi:hypothetical protein